MESLISLLSRELKPKAVPVKVTPQNPAEAALMDEYYALCTKLGVTTPKAIRSPLAEYLAQADIPVYSLPEVIRYMDTKSRSENPNRSGWHWCPATQEDRKRLYSASVRFGSRRRTSTRQWYSDYYDTDECQTYGHVIPMRALKLIDRIKSEYKPKTGSVEFLVSDYSTAQGHLPDPFLMVFANTEHRYVIDFWDEPGFGLEAMLKA